MRTLSSLPPPASRFDARGFDAARFDAQRQAARPARPSPRRGRGLDNWTILLIGAIVLQIPIGWLGDRLNPRRLVIGLSVASALGALIWDHLLETE